MKGVLNKEEYELMQAIVRNEYMIVPRAHATMYVSGGNAMVDKMAYGISAQVHRIADLEKQRDELQEANTREVKRRRAAEAVAPKIGELFEAALKFPIEPKRGWKDKDRLESFEMYIDSSQPMQELIDLLWQAKKDLEGR